MLPGHRPHLSNACLGLRAFLILERFLERSVGFSPALPSISLCCCPSSNHLPVLDFGSALAPPGANRQRARNLPKDTKRETTGVWLSCLGPTLWLQPLADPCPPGVQGCCTFKNFGSAFNPWLLPIPKYLLRAIHAVPCFVLQEVFLPEVAFPTLGTFKRFLAGVFPTGGKAATISSSRGTRPKALILSTGKESSNALTYL